jgi:hypothetical protein
MVLLVDPNPVGQDRRPSSFPAQAAVPVQKRGIDICDVKPVPGQFKVCN